MGFVGVFLMLIFWGGLIVLAVGLTRGLFQQNRTSIDHTGPAESAKYILDQRYARGEITREQYDIMKQDIA